MKKEWKFLSFLLVILLVFTLSISMFSAAELRVTQEHPFFVDGDWIEAKNLVVGDVLKTFDGRLIKITGIEDVFLDEPVEVFNLHVNGVNTFFVNDVLVHNKEPKIWIPVTDTQTKAGYKSILGELKKDIRAGAHKLREPKHGCNPYEGDIYEPFIAENRANIAELAKELDDVDLLISTERGGSLIGDIAVAKSGKPIEHIKILKADKAIQKVQLKQAIENFIATHPGKKVTIASTESVMSGGSARHLRKSVAPFMNNPNVNKIKLILHQETTGLSGCFNEVEGILKIPTGSNLEVIKVKSAFIIGDDVGLGSTKPITIFRETAKGGIETLTITIPEGQTYRDVIIDMIGKGMYYLFLNLNFNIILFSHHAI